MNLAYSIKIYQIKKYETRSEWKIILIRHLNDFHLLKDMALLYVKEKYVKNI